MTIPPESAQPTSWHELTDAVRAAHPRLYLCRVALARDLCGFGRVDSKTVPQITEELDRRALGYLPHPMPYDYKEPIALYLRGTTMGDLVDIVVNAAQGQRLNQATLTLLEKFTPPPAEGAVVDLAEVESIIDRAEELRDHMDNWYEKIAPKRRKRR